VVFSAPAAIRTPDPLLRKQVLYPLSYEGEIRAREILPPFPVCARKIHLVHILRPLLDLKKQILISKLLYSLIASGNDSVDGSCKDCIKHQYKKPMVLFSKVAWTVDHAVNQHPKSQQEKDSSTGYLLQNSCSTCYHCQCHSCFCLKVKSNRCWLCL
jgi:hypothetical protein